ncbi:hypothetical protein [Tsukamurella hominis]|uniref:hypothetical protein n=1 Tax=Tsukamurella hominis TaxID=1970232 RepID=UPI0039EBB554
MNRNKIAFYAAIICTILGIGLFLTLYFGAVFSFAPTGTSSDPLGGTGLTISTDFGGTP